MPLFGGEEQLEQPLFSDNKEPRLWHSWNQGGLQAQCTQTPPGSLLLLCMPDKCTGRSCWCSCCWSKVGFPALQAAARLLLRILGCKHRICQTLLIYCQEIPTTKMYFLLSKPKGIIFKNQQQALHFPVKHLWPFLKDGPSPQGLQIYFGQSFCLCSLSFDFFNRRKWYKVIYQMKDIYKTV